MLLRKKILSRKVVVNPIFPREEGLRRRDDGKTRCRIQFVLEPHFRNRHRNEKLVARFKKRVNRAFLRSLDLGQGQLEVLLELLFFSPNTVCF